MIDVFRKLCDITNNHGCKERSLNIHRLFESSKAMDETFQYPQVRLNA
jgi:hypothetical protein